MVNTPEISVVVPLYGKFNLARTLVSVQSILSQKDINYEVIVSEQGESPQFSEMPGVKHIFRYHKPRTDLSDFNPGNVRNHAITLATGKYIYTNDADIVFTDTRYLSRAKDILEANQGRVLFRPKMRRLPSFE